MMAGSRHTRSTDERFPFLHRNQLILVALGLCTVLVAGAEGRPAGDHEIVAFHRPGMRLFTLEDLFGDTANTFQAAIGFIAFEGTPNTPAPAQSYGLAVDDMVVAWREFTLEQDTTDCAVSGSCAVIELSTGNVFQGQTALTFQRLRPSYFGRAAEVQPASHEMHRVGCSSV